jgi:hypothetical protein
MLPDAPLPECLLGIIVPLSALHRQSFAPACHLFDHIPAYPRRFGRWPQKKNMR